ncbi:MAG: response regulator [Clostridia bacterium]|jgi:two-component system response regulator YesN|nr:response regulator [Clostridia bacterium]
MLKILIADDELLARIGIRSLLDWNAHGYEIVGECENGQKAFEAAKIVMPDIIISDIKMPVVNGIELIKMIHKEGLGAKFIMLSSYDEFEYVREALKLGAEDYILKLEMEAETLLKTLESIKEKIEKETYKKNNRDSKVNLYKVNISNLSKVFLQDCLNGIITNSEEIQERIEMLEINLRPENLICIMIRVCDEDKSYKNNAMIQATTLDIIKKLISEYGCGEVISMDKGILTILSLNQNSEQYIFRLIKNIEQLLKNIVNLTVNIYKSYLFNDLGELYKAYSYVIADSVSDNKKFGYIPLEKELQELESAFRKYDIHLIDQSFKKIYELIKPLDSLVYNRVDRICDTMIFIINTFAKKYKISVDTIWEDSDPYREVKQMRSIKDALEWVSKLNSTILRIINNEDDSKRIIMKAKQYINKNYKDNPSLEDVSHYVSLSPSYFSRLFCKETGETFISYITNVRIDKAKELLRNTQYKVYEIAEMIGYENTHYFSRIFKKVTGQSPYDYREK